MPQAVVTGCLQQALEKELPGRVVPQNETAGAEELLAYMKKTATLKAHALKLGAQVQASHVLPARCSGTGSAKARPTAQTCPHRWHFRCICWMLQPERLSGARAFDKTQQSLSENLLDAPAFFKHGAKWLTAEELTRGGAETMAEKLKGALTGAGGK